MSKEIRALFDDLKRELRAEFKDFKDSIERDFRKELRDIKTSLAHANKEYEEIKVENKELKEANAKLHVLCSDLLQQAKDHECRILQAEQYSRKANVEIKGEHLQELLITVHPDARVANSKGPKPLPEGGFSKLLSALRSFAFARAVHARVANSKGPKPPPEVGFSKFRSALRSVASARAMRGQRRTSTPRDAPPYRPANVVATPMPLSASLCLPIAGTRTLKAHHCLQPTETPCYECKRAALCCTFQPLEYPQPLRVSRGDRDNHLPLSPLQLAGLPSPTASP
ncbi:hypothetical protein HPB52_022926 [Rhipicephalus sanguineus]|uniref:Uncharacterized protein n=1 Tax=Rhipicephalus sanguineus TaxID=34632 RepID=A0A9D4QB16_RHISA|nr:hypothetical protein HPB52_022926 [Rhipicephalus sanguineus]